MARRYDLALNYMGEQMLTAWQMATDKIDDNYTAGCAHCCDERFSTMLTGGFQYAVSHGLPLDWTRAEDLTDDFSTTYPVLEGWLSTGEYQLPPGYTSLGQVTGEMIGFANAFYHYLGEEGLGSCVQHDQNLPGVPDDDTLMGYCNAPVTSLER